jgi:hypothetical protein
LQSSWKPWNSNGIGLLDINAHFVKLYFGILEIEMMIFLIREFNSIHSILSFFMANAMGSEVAEVNVVS